MENAKFTRTTTAGNQVVAFDAQSDVMPVQAIADGSLELQVGGGHVAVFDLDRTLVAGSSLIYLARRLAGAGLLRRRTLARRALQNVMFARRGATDAAVNRVQSSLLALAAGGSYDAVARVLPLAADDVVAHSYAEARRMIDRHRAVGDFCVIASASPQELVDAVAQRIGAHRAVGTRTCLCSKPLHARYR